MIGVIKGSGVGGVMVTYLVVVGGHKKTILENAEMAWKVESVPSLQLVLSSSYFYNNYSCEKKIQYLKSLFFFLFSLLIFTKVWSSGRGQMPLYLRSG